MPKALLLISSSSSTLFIFYIVRCVDCIAKDMLIELSRTILALLFQASFVQAMFLLFS